MKALAYLAILFLILGGAAYIAARLGTGRQARLHKRSKWRAVPRNNKDGGRQIWLVCKGEDDFKFFDENAVVSRPSWSWDEAMMEAEIQAREWNRLRHEGMRELR